MDYKNKNTFFFKFQIYLILLKTVITPHQTKYISHFAVQRSVSVHVKPLTAKVPPISLIAGRPPKLNHN